MAAARNRTIALVITSVALGVGCSREAAPDTPTAQLPTGSAAEATTPPASEVAASEPADPYAIPTDPKDIDKEYVERVLEALTEPIATATRLVVRSDGLTKDARSLLATTHRGEALAGITNAYRQALTGVPASSIFSAQAEPIDIDVKQIIGVAGNCVFVRVRQDTSGLAGKEIPPSTAYYQLGAKRATDDPEGRNPTPWMIVVDAEAPQNGKTYRNPCR